MPAQAEHDAQLVELWLHGRPATTRKAYEADGRAFLAFVAKPLQRVTVGDVQAFASSFPNLAPRSQARKLSVAKSLLTFGHKIGFLPFNVGTVVEAPPIKNALAERIIDEPDVHRALALEPDDRDRVILLLFYAAGVRISELAGLKWRDGKKRGEGGQITVFGKGGKTRVVKLSKATWKQLVGLRDAAADDAPIFWSQKGGHLSVSQIHRVVKEGLGRAGIDPRASAHWLRHSHGSHALERGAPIHLVQQTLGHANVATTSQYLHARPDKSSSEYLPV